MRKRYLLCCLFLILVLSLPALAADISGVVVDARTGQPLPGANVFVKGTSFGAASDKEGKFVFKFEPSQSFVIVSSYMGYKKFEQTFSPSDDLNGLKIELHEDVFQGEEVVVTGIASKR
ncbi:MAG: carboxypeptidase-like regulatory domain-containing protein, partial [candidate division KSB1 bacterium]|nr:carboxypeptidase-like regulatory domain-containing protein [candidate division KSB1 bacterium]